MLKIQFSIRNQDYGSLRCATLSGINTILYPCLNAFDDGGSRLLWNICTHVSKEHSTKSQTCHISLVLNGFDNGSLLRYCVSELLPSHFQKRTQTVGNWVCASTNFNVRMKKLSFWITCSSQKIKHCKKSRNALIVKILVTFTTNTTTVSYLWLTAKINSNEILMSTT